uniref:Uncharacterized protein n=1 Tax=Aegilops tauschii TaxID=37682 RepID=M8BCM5_AEGTA
MECRSLSAPGVNIYAQTNDYSAVPRQLKDQVNERYSSAKRAVLRTGGDFPFLSRPDEVNLYLQLHLRRVGVEPRPDLVQGFTRDGSSGSSNDHEDGNSFDDHPKDDGDRSSGSDGRKTEHSESGPPNSDGLVPTSIVLGMHCNVNTSLALWRTPCTGHQKSFYASNLQALHQHNVKFMKHTHKKYVLNTVSEVEKAPLPLGGFETDKLCPMAG